MRVRAAATLHGCHLLRIREIADVEDANAAETVRTWRRGRSSHAWRGLSRDGRRLVVGVAGEHVAGRQRNALRAAVDAARSWLRLT